jgi:anti-sigma factor RsiW
VFGLAEPFRHRHDPGPGALRLVLDCAEVEAELPSVVDGTRVPSPSVLSHLAHCPGCQAELARYERLLRTLRRLREDVASPAPGVLAAVLAALQSEAAPAWARSKRWSRGLRLALTAGSAVLVGAGVASGAWVLRQRHRAPRPVLLR